MNTEKRLRTAVPKSSRPSGKGADPGRPAPPARGAGIFARLRYRFDLALARGPFIVVGYLGLIMLGIIVVAALLLTTLHLTGVNGGPGLSFGEAFWQSLLRVVDSGTFASDANWPTRVVSLIVTLAGIFLAGSLIGLIANAVDQRIERLGKGRTLVVEHDHTLVLGWSPRLPSILSEIVIANENHRGRSFVVLADRPKAEMEDELKRLVPQTKTTRVVCRTGDIGDVADLRLVNIEGARSVIVLAGETGDAGVVKTVLAVRSIDPSFARIRVVAELENVDTAATVRELTDRRVATVRADDVISQVTAQACHQSGLAAVFRDLLDFDGDEIYFTAVPELIGYTFAQAQLSFEDAAVIGIARQGRTMLNPAADLVLQLGDEVIAIAEDDDRVVFSGYRRDAAADPTARQTPLVEPRQRIALIGWSSLGLTVLDELDQFLAPDSVVDVLVDGSVLDAAAIALPEYARCRVAVHPVRPGPQPLLDALGRQFYDQAIVLGYREGMTASEADARSMLTLLALQRAWGGRTGRPRVVAEMLDRSNVAIAQTTGVDDFIVSDELSSLMLAQLSERLDLQDVFAELFDADGCFVALHPAPCYTSTADTTFANLVATASARGACALGYRLGDSAVVLNPPKSTPVRFGAGDQVLVLAQRTPRVSEPVVFPATEISAPVLQARPTPGPVGPAVAPRITEWRDPETGRHRAGLPMSHLSERPAE